MSKSRFSTDNLSKTNIESIMIIETNSKNPSIHLAKVKVDFLSKFNKTAINFPNVDLEKNYISPSLPKSKAIPRNPSFVVVYKFAPGFHQTSISVEPHHKSNFLNQFA